MCRQRATQILQGAAVTYFDGWYLDACNCSLQLTGDLLCIVQLKCTEQTSALQQVDVSRWQGDFINGYCLAFKV